MGRRLRIIIVRKEGMPLVTNENSSTQKTRTAFDELWQRFHHGPGLNGRNRNRRVFGQPWKDNRAKRINKKRVSGMVMAKNFIRFQFLFVSSFFEPVLAHVHGEVFYRVRWPWTYQEEKRFYTTAEELRGKIISIRSLFLVRFAHLFSRIFERRRWEIFCGLNKQTKILQERFHFENRIVRCCTM